MPSLIDDAEKNAEQTAMLDVFDTFKRPFVVYVEAEKVIINTNPNFSRFGNNAQNMTNPTVVPQPFTIYGVIKHKEDQQYEYVGADDVQIKVKSAKGRCRIKVRIEDAQPLIRAKQFEIDGFQYKPDSTPRPHGLFTPALYTFYLVRSE
jgi:hypothetical protein